MPTIQLHFQPMLTIGDQSDRPDAAAAASPVITTQVVFMLFIEIPSGTAETPFSILASAAQAWALREFPAIQPTSELLPALLSFDKLAGFLAGGADPFEFQILPGSAMTNQAAKLAPFPMLPWLKLTPPAPGAPIDFATRKPCSAGFLASLTDPFAVPKPGAAAATRALQTFPSLAAGMFTDYFVTVIRHLLDNPDAAAAAQAAGLFLMHGIRLPDPDAPTARDYPLYVLSGQQLALPADIGSGLTVNLAASGGGAQPKVSFPKGDGTFTFSTIAAQVTKLLGGATPAAPFAPGDRLVALTQSEPFAVANKRFALSAPVLWSQAGQAQRRIYALPFLLRDQIKAAPLPANSGLDLSLLQGMPDQVAATGYVWATRINFTIRQVADPTTPNRTLPTIYEIAGMDTDSRDDLLTFLTSAEASGGLFDVGLLYSLDAGSKNQGMQSDAVAAGEVWIVKSNLATEAHTAADAATSSADLPGARSDGSNASAMAAYALKAETFLKLLWESGLVATGGFHLFYGHGTGLPATLFGQTGTAVVSVTIVPQPRVAMKPYHNCVVWGGDGTPANVAAFVDPPVFTTAAGDTFASVAGKLNTPVETLLFANATAKIPASGMQQYTVQDYDDLLSLALRYESQPLGTTTLHNLWSSLPAALQQVTFSAGTALQIHPGWVAARPTMPPGCVGFRAVANAPAGALQSLYSFLGVQVGGAAQPGSLPASPQGKQSKQPGATPVMPFYRQILYLAGAAGSDPYAQIGQTATLALQYQDIFGNRCLDAAKAPTLTFQLGYRDSLIGVSQWPGTSVSFDFGGASQIVFTFAFETKRYFPGPGLSFDTVLARAANDLARYNLVAFQLGRPLMRVLVKTSLESAAVPSTDLLSACRAHVKSVCTFLGSVLALTKVTSGVTHSSLAGIAADHPGLKVEDLATVNQDVPNLLAIPGVQLAIPKLYTVNRNESLAGIIARQGAPLEALAAYNQNVPNLFPAGTQIQIGATTYKTQANDALASIAAAMSVTVAQLAAASQSTVLQAGAVIQTGQTLYDLRSGDTLQSIASGQKVAVEALATANQDAQILKAGAAIKTGATTRSIQACETLASIASGANMTVSDLAAANQGGAVLLPGAILQAGATQYTIRGADTLGSVARDQRVTVALLATANKDRAILNTADATVLIEIPVTPALPDFAPAPIPYTVTPTIASTITPVSVSLVIARPNGSVDQLFADASQFPDIQSVESEIRPAAEIGQNRAALRAFAARFEAAFSALHLMLALGPDHAGTAEATTAKRFYAVRFQDVNPVFPVASLPRFYAPAPLLNTGWSGSIISGGATVNFTNVDLDAWAGEFVTTLDLLLSPPYAAGLHASGQSATYHSLVSSKATIANAMGAAVMPVLESTQPSANDLTAAQDLLYQRVLVQLQEFYKVDAIVQFAVTTAYTGDTEAGNVAARLSGSLSGSLGTPTPPGARPDFTLSDATIDLQLAASELTFLLHLASSSQFADLQLALRFDPRDIDVESAFQGATLAPGYEAFDRLVLLPSSDASSDPFATIDIPVPLRAYPVPPSLITQEVVQSLPDRPRLADLKTFEYRFRFNYATAGQDQLQFHLTTLPATAAADPGVTAAPAANPVDALPEALAAWTVSAASLNTALAGLLDSAPDQAAVGAATTFATLAGTIAAAWSTRSPQLAQPVAQVLAAGIELTQDNPASPDEHLVTVRSISPPDPLNVIAVQSVTGSLHVTRNRVLAGGNVNPAFVYQVPTVQFTNPVVPLFRSDDPIDITALPEPPFITTQDALRRQVATLIANLLDATAQTPKDILPNIRIAVAFEFALAEASAAGAVLPALVTRVPVALLPPSAFDPTVDFLGDGGMCARVAQELLRWHALQAPPAGAWVFDVSLYSNVGGDSNQPLPLLELTNLRAPAAA